MASGSSSCTTPLGRTITAMVTPFDDASALDLDAVGPLVDHLLSNGVDGIVTCGTTGESPTLTKPEKLELIRAVKSAVGGRCQVIAGTGSNATADTIEMTKAAQAAGADAVMVVVPYYNKPPQEGMYRHFRAAAEATSLPVVLYNVPGRTACNMTAETVIRLAADVENIVALKEAAGDIAQASRVIAETPDDFYLFSGEDELNLDYLRAGADGFISVTAHVIGRELNAMCDAHARGDMEEAQAINLRTLPITKALFTETNPILVKAAMNLLGVRVGGLRLPLVEGTQASVDAVKAELVKLGRFA